MKFTSVLLILTPLALAQDLSSLLSAASSAYDSATSVLATNSDYSSLLSEVSSATSALATNSYYQSLTSQYSSALSEASAAASSVYNSAVGSAAASATGAGGVDKVVLPAMGVVGAGVLGLAALL